jgi:polar amino acid transport system substrate-binding protein
MGLQPDIQNVTFDAILPGLEAGKYDLGMSSFTDTKEREATVDFVTYLTAGSSIYTKADGGPDATSLDALCGLKVAAERGTTQSDQIDEQTKKCTSGGQEAITPVILPDQNGVNTALSAGRADAAMADSPVAAYIVEKSEGQFKVTGGPFPPEPYGIAIPKDNGMAPAVQAAVQALIDNGTYTKILEYWDLTDGAIDAPVINGAVS